MSDKVRRIGYLRISPTDQNPGAQADALQQAGRDHIHQPTASSNPSTGESLRELLELLGDGDTLLVYRMDRLSRDEFSVVKLQQQLEAMGVTLVVTDDQETTGGNHE